MKRWRALPVLGLALLGLSLFAAPKPRGGRAVHPRGAESGARARAEKPPRAMPSAPLVGSRSPWSDRDSCLGSLAAAPPRPPHVARVGAWNLHWFPDGRPGRPRDGGGTDLEWLACAIAHLGVDVLAVSEIKHGATAAAALGEVASHLARLSGRKFRFVLDDCPKASSQHVGLLWDERIRLGVTTTLGMLNPHGEPCKDQLRPGLAGHFTFPGGLDLTVVAVHLKSGSERRALELRKRSFEAFNAAARAARTASGDRDVLVIGDMNTMGCDHCSPKVAPEEELAAVDGLLGRADPPMRRLPATQACSHFYRGRTTLLDWAAVSDLGELGAAPHVQVSGTCALLACRGTPPAATTRLSDHCPVFLDIEDVDRDPSGR